MDNLIEIKAQLNIVGNNGGVEAGHYYQAIGPTLLSAVGWKIGQEIIQPNNKSLLLIDDIHPTNPFDHTDVIDNWNPEPYPDIIVYESETIAIAFDILVLANKHNMVKSHKGKNMFKSGFFPLQLESGQFTCSLLDYALSVMKWGTFDLDYFVNVLPESYQHQQSQLYRLADSLNPLQNLTNKTFNSYYYEL